MKKVINLNNGNEFFYMDHIEDMHCVAQAYCSQNNLLSWFNAMVEQKIHNALKSLPIVEGEKTIACGDFCIVKEKA